MNLNKATKPFSKIASSTPPSEVSISPKKEKKKKRKVRGQQKIHLEQVQNKKYPKKEAWLMTIIMVLIVNNGNNNDDKSNK